MKKIEVFEKDILYHYYFVRDDQSGMRSQVLRAFSGMVRKKYKYIGTPQRVTYYVSGEREDYRNFMDSVTEKVSEKCELHKQVDIGLNLRNLVMMIRRIDVFKKTRTFTLPQTDDKETIVKPSFWERLVIFFNLITGMGMYDSFSKLNFSQTKKIVVLGDVWQEESMLIQYANDAGIDTVTCQHALFIPGLDNSTIDILNIWEVKAKKALLWGKYHENLYKKFNPDLKCKICGNPTIREKKYKENPQILGIVLDLPRMHDYNQRMIKIVEQYAGENDKNILIRIHPADKEEAYEINTGISAFAKNLDWTSVIIGHTTTMCFTYLASGKRIAKFESDVKFFPLDKRMVFKTSDELGTCLNSTLNIDFHEMTQEEILYIGEESKEKYKKELEEAN